MSASMISFLRNHLVAMVFVGKRFDQSLQPDPFLLVSRHPILPDKPIEIHFIGVHIHKIADGILDILSDIHMKISIANRLLVEVYFNVYLVLDVRFSDITLVQIVVFILVEFQVFVVYNFLDILVFVLEIAVVVPLLRPVEDRGFPFF